MKYLNYKKQVSAGNKVKVYRNAKAEHRSDGKVCRNNILHVGAIEKRIGIKFYT